MEISSRMFIHENVLVDPFMADLKIVVFLEPVRCLLRAPFLADQRFDQDPGEGFYAIPGFLTSVQSKLLSLLGSVTFLSTMASEFSADRGFVNLHMVCNFRLYVSCSQKCINLVSLFLGKLRVGSHLCSFMELYVGQAFAHQVIEFLNTQGYVLHNVYNLEYNRQEEAIQGDFTFAKASD
jgi:hypothetical protein